MNLELNRSDQNYYSIRTVKDFDKGKPVAERGRKTKDLSDTAW